MLRTCAAAVVVLSAAGFAMSASGPASAGQRHTPACASASGTVRCAALVLTGADAEPQTTSGPSGYSPTTIKGAYGFPTSSTAGAGTTIALVTAYDAPTIGSDLKTFSTRFGLPPCTGSNGCFKKVNQNGGRTFPKVAPGWALEASLDVEWAHAIAPGAKILLVEASSSGMGNLLKAVDYAKAHAQYVSMSWGTDEYASEVSADAHFVQSGVSFFAASGDWGLPAIYPSASPKVISVGGTTLNRPIAPIEESGWSDAGGGCSTYETAAPAQRTFNQYPSACAGRRATPDVSLDANPSTGVAVYDSTTFKRHKGWFTVGGTSASSPMVAARSAATASVVDANAVYGNTVSFRDINVGNNGAACANGYELCTGRGSWTG